jgi:hypothetical protein
MSAVPVATTAERPHLVRFRKGMAGSLTGHQPLTVVPDRHSIEKERARFHVFGRLQPSHDDGVETDPDQIKTGQQNSDTLSDR